MNDYAKAVEPYVSALRMIRQQIEDTFGPIANLESEEAVLLRGPEPTHEAEAICLALRNASAHIVAFNEQVALQIAAVHKTLDALEAKRHE